MKKDLMVRKTESKFACEVKGVRELPVMDGLSSLNELLWDLGDVRLTDDADPARATHGKLRSPELPPPP